MRLFIFTILLFVVFLSLLRLINSGYTFIRSTVDNRCYKVRNNGIQQQNANALAIVNQKIMELIAFIKKVEPGSFTTCRLGKYDPGILQENLNNFDTTFTINKGKSMHFCISNRTGNLQIYDTNTLTYVAIHELAHIITTQIGHGIEFKRNNIHLLNHAIKANIYNYVDYKKSPAEYCGLRINVNILDQV